MTKENII